ncbi:hypothetical protein [Endozoicomonas numazuensis]|uniref:Uncharacterized protein n=1 Tax=Endozoicomonas numazuensis TaxID=1137799 RepID=A0A081NL43_9GAMM|nr:hypothetical protein [Endozoicomonas numazuensis]KEQ19166.1 hypothetical protein GZ78_03990 [Endozoicomonas numazuensis]
MRTLPPELISAFQSPQPNIIFLVELDWPGGVVRVHSGIGELRISGRVWLGMGSLGGIGQISDDDELGRSELPLELSGFEEDLLRESFRRDSVGREGVVYAAARDGSGLPIEASFTPMFAGYISDVGTTLGDSNTISVELATDTADPRRKRPGRYTDESHRREYPGDQFYKWSAKTADRPIYWGSKRDAYPYK